MKQEHVISNTQNDKLRFYIVMQHNWIRTTYFSPNAELDPTKTYNKEHTNKIKKQLYIKCTIRKYLNTVG